MTLLLTVLTAVIIIIKKYNQKIKSSCSGQSAVSSRHSGLGLQIYFFIISKMLTALTMGRGVKREGTGVNGQVIITNIIYTYIIN